MLDNLEKRHEAFIKELGSLLKKHRCTLLPVEEQINGIEVGVMFKKLPEDKGVYPFWSEAIPIGDGIWVGSDNPTKIIP